MCGVTFKNQPSVGGQLTGSICSAYPLCSIAVTAAIFIQEAVRYTVYIGSAYAKFVLSGQPSTY